MELETEMDMELENFVCCLDLLGSGHTYSTFHCCMHGEEENKINFYTMNNIEHS